MRASNRMATLHGRTLMTLALPGRRAARTLSLLLFAALSAVACAREGTERPNPIVGTWLVEDPNAPFPYHLYVFGGDGTMHQANPDAGDPRTSDSDGKGVWEARGGEVRGKWVEVMADRTTHQFVGRLEITMTITVAGDSLRATEVVAMFDSTGAPVPVPATPKTLTGTRVTAR